VSHQIDIIIPNYNGAAHLPVCLAALRAQTRQDFRVLVVDDGSQDESLVLLARDFPEVRVLALPRNRGLAAAVNAGIDASAAPYVVLLNNDTEAAPDWLAHLVGALDADPRASFAASKLLLFDQRDRLHSAGDLYRVDGIPGNRGVWQRDEGQFDTAEPVFGACAGAAAYRRAALWALAEVGKNGRRRVFDEDLVMYCEDVDLNLRAWRAGLLTRYVPEARVYHKLSATGGGALASYFCGRNFVLVWVKNMPADLLRRYWPHMLAAQLGYGAQSLRHIRERAARARLWGQLAALLALPRFLAKRQALVGKRIDVLARESRP